MALFMGAAFIPFIALGAAFIEIFLAGILEQMW